MEAIAGPVIATREEFFTVALFVAVQQRLAAAGHGDIAVGNAREPGAGRGLPDIFRIIRPMAGRAMRKIRICVGTILAISATMLRADPPPAYRICFDRPVPVGQSWHMDLTVVRSLTWKYLDPNGQSRPGGERLYGCRLAGRMTALAEAGTDATGRTTTRCSIAVEALCGYDGKKDQTLLPTGSTVLAQPHGRSTTFTVDGKAPTPAVQRALAQLVRLSSDPNAARYHDRAFGIDRPVRRP